MKLKVSIDQRATIAAGIPAPHSTELLEFEPAAIHDPDLRAFIAERLDFATGEVKVYFQWDGKLPWKPNSGSHCAQTPPTILGPVTLDAALTAVRQLHQAWQQFKAHETKEQAERQAADEAQAAQSRAQFLAGQRLLRDETSDSFGSPNLCESVYDDCIFLDNPHERVPRTPEMEPAIQAYFARRQAATQRWQQQQAEAKARQEAEQAQREAEQRQLLATAQRLIQEHGSEPQKARLARNLMADPIAEATRLLTDRVFSAVDLPVFPALTADDVDLPEDYSDHDADNLPRILRASNAPDALSDCQMAAYLTVEARIKSALPAAEVEPWLHEITRDHRDIPWTKRLCARATVQQDGFTLTRDYAV